MMKYAYTYPYWKSKLTIIVVFIILNNLMGCEKICLVQPSSINVTNEEVGPTTASFNVEIITGDDPSLSDTEVGCDEDCETIACTLRSFNYKLLDAEGNSIVADPAIYDNIFTQHNVQLSGPKNRISESITLGNLTPATVYQLTVAFPVAYTCFSFGPKERTITFTTLPGLCNPLDCGENGTFNQETCACNCDEGYSGGNCEAQNTIAPANLLYNPDSMVVSINQEAVSPLPSVEGTPPFNYEIALVHPSNQAVTAGIDASTGVISLTSMSVNDVQGYQVDVRVSNSAGAAVFAKAYVVTVTDHGSTGPPIDLVYEPDTVTYNGLGFFDSVVPTVTGTGPFTFSVAGVSPETAAGAINIITETGVISAADLREFGLGTYQVDVVVANDAGSTTFNQVYTLIVE